MGKKPVIIFYSEGLNSYLLYSKLIKNYPQLIKCLVEFPAIPRVKHKNFIKQPMLKRILERSSASFILFNFYTVVLFRLIASIFRNRLKDVANANHIPVLKYKHMDERFVEDIKTLKPDWIINGSPNIIKKNLIQIPQLGILNYHGAPLPEYRGAGNYFWMLFNREKSVRGTLHYVDEGIDTGDIILYTENVSIVPGMTVFELWYKMRTRAYPAFKKIIPYILSSRPIPAVKQDKSKAQLRSFPDRNTETAIKKYGHKVINFKDLLSVVKIAATGKIPEKG